MHGSDIRGIYHLNAFTKEVNGGNPAGLCILGDYPAKDGKPFSQTADLDNLHLIADYLALPTTAFLLPAQDGTWHIRWLKPHNIETPLCGHATLAASHYLFSQDPAAQNRGVLYFHTHTQGRVEAQWNNAMKRVEIAFPLKPITQRIDREGGLGQRIVRCLNLIPADVNAIVRNDLDIYVEIASCETLRHLKPDFEAISQLSAEKEINTRGIGITARSDCAEYDIESRMFFPRLGANEDHVTGSMHCGLVDYWREFNGVLRSRFSSQRGGDVWAVQKGDQVAISGDVVLVKTYAPSDVLGTLASTL